VAETVPPASAPPEIVARELTKVYRGDVRAADGVSLWARRGEIVGIVGPNGAGKSTVLNMIATLVPPTSGSATVWGVPITDVDRLRPLLGVALQTAGLDPLMTVREHFEVQAALYRVPREDGRTRTAWLVERFSLEPYADRTAGQLSGGTARRLALALALVGNPPVIVFDEPSVGLDPRSRRDLWGLVREMRDQGRTILLSTQYLEEADALCDRVYLIDGGRIVLSGSPAQLKREVGGATLRVRVAGDPQAAVAALRGELPGVQASIEGDTLVLALDGDVAVAGDVLAAARARGIGVRGLHVAEPTLDDVFLRYTGRALEAEPLSGPGFDLGAVVQRGGGKKWR
jgi:ABC-2 type transport system ATP-binding protein